MKKIFAAICLGLFITGASAQGQSALSYSNISAGYQSGSINLSGVTLDTSGYGIAVSAAVSDSLFLLGSLSDGTAKISGVSVDQNTFSFGLGGHTPLSKQTDFVGSISYINSKASIYGYSSTVTGLGFDLGLRHALSEKIELNGGVGLSILGSDRVQTSSVGIGVRYKIADKLSLGVGYIGTNSDNVTSQGVTGTLRVDF